MGKLRPLSFKNQSSSKVRLGKPQLVVHLNCLDTSPQNRKHYLIPLSGYSQDNELFVGR